MEKKSNTGDYGSPGPFYGRPLFSHSHRNKRQLNFNSTAAHNVESNWIVQSPTSIHNRCKFSHYQHMIGPQVTISGHDNCKNRVKLLTSSCSSHSQYEKGSSSHKHCKYMSCGIRIAGSLVNLNDLSLKQVEYVCY